MFPPPALQAEEAGRGEVRPRPRRARLRPQPEPERECGGTPEPPAGGERHAAEDRRLHARRPHHR